MAFRLTRFFALIAVLVATLTSCNSYAQADFNQDQLEVAYHCGINTLFVNNKVTEVTWFTINDARLLVQPDQRCWVRMMPRQPLLASLPVYFTVQNSPMLAASLYDSQGRKLAQSSRDNTSFQALEIGRRTMFPAPTLRQEPFYLRLDSFNPTFPERMVVRGLQTLEDGIRLQSNTLIVTVFAATVLLTSALFTAAFGIALKDLDFAIYSLYSFFTGLTLLAWDQIDLLGVGNHYGWLWQLFAPVSTMMLCWLTIRLGQFNKYSRIVALGLKLFIAVNGLMLLWSIATAFGLPLSSMSFDRFNYENWQDTLLGALIMLGGWHAWRRAEKDGLLMLLSLSPSMFSDLINRVWDPVVASLLQSDFALTLPPELNQLIHINGSLTWLALPLVFCYCLARRALLLHRSLVEERKLLENRVVQRTQDLHAINKELELLATTDSLTGLANRRRMMEWINHEMDRSYRSKKSLALCMIDVDNFKFINDNYGHPTGDRVIATIASMFNEVMRRTDIASRFGGEEFLLLMPETDASEAAVVSERVREVIAALPFFSDEGYPFGLTVSIGVALFDPNATDDTISNLLNKADKALYSAKNAGRNKVIFA